MVVLVFNKSADSFRRGTGSSAGSRPPSVVPAAAVASEDDLASRPSREDARHSTELASRASVADSSDGFVTEVPQASRRDRSLTEPSLADRALLQDAEVRAEQQAACRDTMLSLRDAFEGALNMQARVEELRQQDRDRLAQLQAQHRADQKKLQDLLRQLDAKDNGSQLKRRISELQAEVEEHRQQLEDAKVEKWKDRLHNNKGSFNFVMLLSREAHPLGCMSNDLPGSEEPESDATEMHVGGSTGYDSTGGTLGGGQAHQSDLAHAYDTTGARPSSREAGAHAGRRGRSVGFAGAPADNGDDGGQEASSGSKASTGGPSGQARSALSQARSASKITVAATKSARSPAVDDAECDSPSAAVAVDERGSKAGWKDEQRLSLSALAGAGVIRQVERTTGDNLTLSWIIKLWRHAISSAHFVRQNDKGIQVLLRGPRRDCVVQTEDMAEVGEEKKDNSAEMLEQLREQHRLELEAERQKSQSLQDQVMDLKYDMKQADQLREQAEKERDALAGQLAEAHEGHRLEKERLLAEAAKAKKELQIQLAQKEQDLKELRQQFDSQRDALQRERAAFENERRTLKANLRDMTSELQNAISQARRMQLMAEKLKREGVGPLKDQLALLLRDLDAAKNKLSVAIKDRNEAVEKTDGLQRRLGHTTRKMELERQFLPLIHLAAGPMGQQNKALSRTSNSKSEPKLPSIAQGEMLQ